MLAMGAQGRWAQALDAVCGAALQHAGMRWGGAHTLMHPPLMLQSTSKAALACSNPGKSSRWWWWWCPPLTAPQCLAAGTCCPQKRELPQAGDGGEPEHPTAHTVWGAAQALLGRGSVSRRQRGLCHGWQVSAWLMGLSSQVSTQPSQREPGKATFKAWGK